MDDLKTILLDHGAALVGYADLSELPPANRHGLARGVSIAVALDPLVISGIADGPTREYYEAYTRANYLLNALSAVAAGYLDRTGYEARPLAATNVGVNPQTHSTLLPHKTVATRAGLGWIGKCALLVTPRFGSAVRITSVLTDAPLETAEPVNESQCGDCTACAGACPGKAPSGRSWRVGVHRDDFFDAHACRAAAREIAAKRADILDTVCGICIAACPHTNDYIARATTAAM